MGGLRDTLSDVAETLRRAFRDPPCQSVRLDMGGPATGGLPSFEVSDRTPAWTLSATARREPALDAARTTTEGVAFQARLHAEEGWSGWTAEALLCQPEMLTPGACARVSVPPLPRLPGTSRLAIPPLAVQARSRREPLAAPAVRAASPALGRPGTRRDLTLALGLPVAVTGLDLRSISRALWMRYTLQLVRATGENIRNLEVLGVYMIPAMGVRGVNHQPATGRLLVEMGPEAAGVRRSPFMLACRKSDRSVVSCFLEEG